MSLDYNFENVKNPERWGNEKEEQDCTREELTEWAKLRYFAWLLVAVDMGEVTKKNLDEVTFRAALFQTMVGEVFALDGSPYLYSTADIESYVGYSTNVSTTTRSAFTKKVSKITEDKITRQLTTNKGE